MQNAGFDAEILQDFLTESGELIDRLEHDTVELDAAPGDRGRLDAVFRPLHTIKGSASFLGLTNLVTIAHAAESALSAAREGQAVIDSSAMDVLLAAIDTIKGQLDDVAAGHELRRADQRLVEFLSALGHGQPPAAGAAAAAPSEAGEAAGSAAVELELASGQVELFDSFVRDLDETLGRLSEAVEAAGAGVNAAVARRIADCGDELLATVSFFDLDQLRRMVAVLIEAAERLPGLDGSGVAQVVPRLAGLVEVLLAQADYIRERRVKSFPVETLLEHLSAAAAGEALPGWAVLPRGADAEAALAADGVIEGEPKASAEPVGTSERVPDRAPPAPAEAMASVEPSSPAVAGADEAGAEGRRGAAPEATIRVEVSRLERLMNLVGELVLQKNRVAALSRALAGSGRLSSDESEQVDLAAGGLDRVTSEMQLAVMKTRMQPLEKLFGKYPRLIRDLSSKTGKKLRLELAGGDTEVDKSVIEELNDPLVHLIRNSVDHGIELPEQREAAGKDATGTITLRASHEGSHVRLVISDDGRGMDRSRIARKAVERGMIAESQTESLTDAQVFEFVMLPGFSTAEAVSDLSGRGVGMDVVRSNIRRIKGSLSIESQPGRGTSIIINIPLTVAILPAMMVAIGREIYAVPLESILEIVRPEECGLTTIGEAPVLRVRNQVIPMLDGAQLFGQHGPRGDEPAVAVLLSRGDRVIAVRVSRVIGQQEIVVKPLEGVETTGPVSGATVRDDGGVSLIVDVDAIVRGSR